MPVIETKGAILIFLIVIVLFIIIFFLANERKTKKKENIKNETNTKNQDPLVKSNQIENKTLKELKRIKKSKENRRKKLSLLHDLVREYLENKADHKIRDINEAILFRIKNKAEMNSYIKNLMIATYSEERIKKSTMNKLIDDFEYILKAESHT